MVPSENKDITYAQFAETNKDYYGIFRNGLLHLTRFLAKKQQTKEHIRSKRINEV